MIDLAEKRREKNVTQEQLAYAVGVSRQAISNIEVGLAKPDISNAKKIGEYLGFNWTEFYDD